MLTPKTRHCTPPITFFNFQLSTRAYMHTWIHAHIVHLKKTKTVLVLVRTRNVYVLPISPYPHASLSEEIIGLDNTIMYYFARNGRSIGQWSSILIMVKRVSGCYQKRKRTSNISPARHCNYAYTASSLSRSGMADDGRRPQQQSIPTQSRHVPR